MNLKIEQIETDKIKKYPYNAKKHPPEQIQKIANSIQQFGFLDPIAIDEKCTIIEGNGRYEAAKLLGLETIPIIRLHKLPEAQKKAYIIAHNKLNTSTGYDEEMLQAEINAILSSNDLQGIDLDSIGITDKEMEGILNDIDKMNIEDITPLPMTQASPEIQQKYTDQNCKMPIVSSFFEHHEAFIIPVHNSIDEAFIRDIFALNEVHKSNSGDRKVRKTNVIDIEKVKKWAAK